MAGPDLFTLGHSNHSFAHLLALLRRHGVEVVADVRSRPYSRFVPHVSKDRLEALLDADGIGYVFLGRELGGKPLRGDPPAARLGYAERVRDPAFQDGIERLLEAASAAPTAILCRERDPLDCHRLHLVCRYVRPMTGAIRHILADGRIEAQAETERRLLEQAGLASLPLFGEAADDDAALARAYDALWWERR